MMALCKQILMVIGVTASTVVLADPTGTWRTIDDRTGQAKSLVKITIENGKYVGRITDVLNGPAVCEVCEGEFHGKNLIGQTILWNVVTKGDNSYGGGTIQDPKTGSTYSVSLTDNGNSMVVRGYKGISMLGRNQTWQRVR